MSKKVSVIAVALAFFCLLAAGGGGPVYAQTDHRLAGGGAVLKIEAGAYTVSGHDIDPVTGGVKIGVAEFFLPAALGRGRLLLEGMTAEIRTGKTAYAAVRDGIWRGRMPITLPGVSLPTELMLARVGRAGLAIDVAVKLPEALGAGVVRFAGLKVRPDASFDPVRTTIPVPARLGDLSAECTSARLEAKGLIMETLVLDTGFPIQEGAVALKEVLVGGKGIVEHRSADSSAVFKYGAWTVKVSDFRPVGDVLHCTAALPSAIYPEGAGFPLTESVFRGNGVFVAEVGDLDSVANPAVVMVGGQFLFVKKASLTEAGLEISEARLETPASAGGGELVLKGIVVDADWKVVASPFTAQEPPLRTIGENGLYANLEAVAAFDDHLVAVGSVELYEGLSPKGPTRCDADHPMRLDGQWVVNAEGESVDMVIGGFPAKLNGWVLSAEGLDGTLSLEIPGPPALHFSFSEASFYSDGTFRSPPRLEDWSVDGTLGGFDVKPYEVRLSEDGLKVSVFLDEMTFESIYLAEDGGYESSENVDWVVASPGSSRSELHDLSFSTEIGVSATEGFVEISSEPADIAFRGTELAYSFADDAYILESENFTPFVYGGGVVRPRRVELRESGFSLSGDLVTPSELPEGLAGVTLPLEALIYDYAEGRAEIVLGALDPAIAIVDAEGRTIAADRIGLSLIEGQIRLSIKE